MALPGFLGVCGGCIERYYLACQILFVTQFANEIRLDP